MRTARWSRHLAWAAFVAPATAQTPPELVGLVNSSPAQIVRQDMTTCSITRCATTIQPSAVRLAGGTAWDATRGAVWVSNGDSVRVINGDTCRVICTPHVLPEILAPAAVTGLAVNEAARVLVVADSRNRISQYRLACPVTTLVARCDASSAIPPRHDIGDIATDDVNDLVIFSSSDFSGTRPASSVLHVARRADPCSPVCRVPIPESCGGRPLGPIRGVGFDACNRVVWATDGNTSIGLRLSSTAPCGPVGQVRCCPLNLSSPYVGLCVVPSRATSVGRSCTNLGCTSCPTMAHVTNGDPALGNGSFGLLLDNAPARARVALWVNAGPCDPAGISVPPFCGAVHVPIAPPPMIINLGTGGTSGCTGTMRVPLPIPLDSALCGGTLSSQCFGLCPQMPFGTFVSNCLSWSITGS